MIRNFKSIVTLFAGSLFAATSAEAQIWGDWFPDELLPSDIFAVDSELEETYIDVGAAVVSRPSFLGSDSQDTDIFPYIGAEYKGRWYINPVQGIGFNPVNNSKLKISTGLSFVSGRDGKDTVFSDNALDLDPGAAAVVNARYLFKYAAVEATASQSLGGDVEGLQVSGRIGTLIPVSKQFRLAPAISVAWQDEDRRTSFYGVDRTQNLITQTGEVSYDSDFTNISATLGGFWRSDDRKWRIISLVQYRELVGDVKDSPFVTETGGLLGVVGFARRY